MCVRIVRSNKNFSFIIKRFFLVFLAAFVIAGWWFIRNMIIYNGDILGRKAASLCAEVNAIPSFKPSQKKLFICFECFYIWYVIWNELD